MIAVYNYVWRLYLSVGACWSHVQDLKLDKFSLEKNDVRNKMK